MEWDKRVLNELMHCRERFINIHHRPQFNQPSFRAGRWSVVWPIQDVP